MHTPCMATKTISVHLDAYERLRAARRSPSESFSQVILRARWPEVTLTGRELLERLREKGSHFSDAELDRIERLKQEEHLPEDKWGAG
jgi:predicted CopG family antitoxin